MLVNFVSSRYNIEKYAFQVRILTLNFAYNDHKNLKYVPHAPRNYFQSSATHKNKCSFKEFSKTI